MFVGEVQPQDAPEGLSHVHHVLYPQVVQDASQVIHEGVQQRLELVFVNDGLAHPPHIGTQDAILAGQQRHPVVPELAVPREPVLKQHRRRGLPRVGEVVVVIVQLHS